MPIPIRVELSLQWIVAGRAKTLGGEVKALEGRTTMKVTSSSLVFVSIRAVHLLPRGWLIQVLSNVSRLQNIAKIAKAAPHKLPGKSSFKPVFPVCPVCPYDHDNHDDNDDSDGFDGISDHLDHNYHLNHDDHLNHHEGHLSHEDHIDNDDHLDHNEGLNLNRTDHKEVGGNLTDGLRIACVDPSELTKR